jgi:DNA (cytosine-5)-methyltransferase 1
MRFGSVCSGIEAASVAWNPLGWDAAWFSEIEKFPCAVLQHHYPTVPNYGDMSLLPQRVLSGEVEAPDLLCGGTPCQAFSVAGLRKSLEDARGNLSLKFCELANAIDNVRSVRSIKPAIVFWENVPGVLNTNDNAFGCFLGALAGENEPLVPPGGRWSNAGCVFGPQRAVAWRVLDAQYFGVAQRRRRVFVVASARDDIDPTKILFEFDGVRRDSAPSRKAGERVAPTIAGCSNGGGSNGPGRDIDSVESLQPYPIANTLTARMHKGINSTVDEGQTPVVTHSLRGEGFDASEDGTGRGTPLVPVAMRESGQGYWMQDDIAGTLRAEGEDRPSRPSHVIGVPVAFHPKQDPISIHPHCIGRAPESGQGDPSFLIPNAMQVRRLTPTECERLQGFPDNYTNIKDKCPDGPRYKALGNSWAVPVVRWIGSRIDAAVQQNFLQ